MSTCQFLIPGFGLNVFWESRKSQQPMRTVFFKAKLEAGNKSTALKYQTKNHSHQWVNYKPQVKKTWCSWQFSGPRRSLEKLEVFCHVLNSSDLSVSLQTVFQSQKGSFVVFFLLSQGLPRFSQCQNRPRLQMISVLVSTMVTGCYRNPIQ